MEKEEGKGQKSNAVTHTYFWVFCFFRYMVTDVAVQGYAVQRGACGAGRGE